MDIPKPTPKRRFPVLHLAGVALLVVGLVAGYARFAASSSEVTLDRDAVVVGTVALGDFERTVRAPGRLVPRELRWIAATSNARVEEILLDPGDAVGRDSVVMSLSNPDLEEALDSLALELEVLEAEYRALERRLANDRLTQESVVADFNARYELAVFRKDANLQLADKAVSKIELNEAVLQEASLKTRYEIEQRRLASLADLHGAELAAKRSRINQAGRTLALQQKLFDELEVRAEFDGLLQDVPVEQGQQLTKGAIVARVADSNDLKAELRVQESQVKDVRQGQSVRITAGRNAATGTVRRVEPEVQEGVVIVEVDFAGALPEGARPDLRIDGVIMLERIPDALVLRRPVFSQGNVTLGLFVLTGNGRTATRRQVSVGSTSTDEIQILEGLAPGDRVIVSDMSEFNQSEEIHLRGT